MDAETGRIPTDMTGDRQEHRDLGALIVAARHRARLDQKGLAEAIGVNEDTLGRYERGDARTPAALLRTIARECDVRADWFTQSFDEAPRDAALAALERRVRDLEDRDQRGEESA